MIKKFLVLAAFALITLPVVGQGIFSQNDGFFNQQKTTRSEHLEGMIPEFAEWKNYNSSGSAYHEELEFEEIQAPLGNAILPLSILGLSYLFAKNKRKEETI